MTSKSFSVRIFFQDGHVDGVKILAKSKWPGRGLVFPRTSLPEEMKRDELNTLGVYVLIGQAPEDAQPTLFIGSGNPLCQLLADHDANKEFWSWTIVCAAKDNTLMPAHIEYLEARLIQLALEAGNAHLDNKNAPVIPELSDEELAYSESFLEHMLSICPVVGLRAFESNMTSTERA